MNCLKNVYEVYVSLYRGVSRISVGINRDFELESYKR